MFRATAVFVAQTASLLYRRMPSCRTARWPERLISTNAQPIGNRRYSRLTICATLNRYSGRVGGGRIIVVEQYGPILGAALLLAVSACGVLLARKANRNVRQFREENHESFLGGKRP